MPEFLNPHEEPVTLPGPGATSIRVRPRQRINLPAFFMRYVSTGQLILADSAGQARVMSPKLNGTPKTIKPAPESIARLKPTPTLTKKIIRRENVARSARNVPPKNGRLKAQIVGRKDTIDPNVAYQSVLDNSTFPISNGIAVGILSHNRLVSLQRLVASIERFTDLNKTTVFISDDGSTDQYLLGYLSDLQSSGKFVILRNATRRGIAANTNRLLRCMARFQYGLLLNDDVEVLEPGWDSFYVDAHKKTGIHHFCLRQPGVYGAQAGQAVNHRGTDLNFVREKPHGAAMFYTRELFHEIGYFDESFGLYGMEHVDWSTRAQNSKCQGRQGFFDVTGSTTKIIIHPEQSSIPSADRVTMLAEAKKRFADLSARTRISHSHEDLPSISYVIPVRVNGDRQNAIGTIIRNIAAQRYPIINTIIVEQDSEQRLLPDTIFTAKHYLAPATPTQFNKAIAFNTAVSKAPDEHIILQDADIALPCLYTQRVADLLVKHESVHIGKQVVYADRECSERVCSSGAFTRDIRCERVVGYFEGGSIGIRKKSYWAIGGFNEDFWGYGVEDTEFFERMKLATGLFNERTQQFLHLWHSRTPGWDACHMKNKELGIALSKIDISMRLAKLINKNKHHFQ